MEFTELTTELGNYADTPEFEDYVSGLMTDDRMTKYLESDNGKKFMQPKYDSYFSKGLETWKTNNLAKEVDAEVQKRYPDQTPEQKRIAELESKMREAEAKAQRSELTNKAMRIANEKQLPTDLIDFFVGADEATTTANLERLEAAMNAKVESIVKAKLGDSHKPESNGREGTPDLVNMSSEERQKYFRERRHNKNK